MSSLDSAERQEANEQSASLTVLAFRSLRKDKAAIFAFTIVSVFLFLAIFADAFSLITHLNPYTLNDKAIDLENSGFPKGAWGGISSAHWFGVEPGTGRDLFMRFVHGARTSLVIAFTATILTTTIGTTIGLVAGYFGGWAEKVVSRVVDFMLSFPSLLFIIASTPVIENSLTRFGIQQSSNLRVIIIISVLTLFGWTFPARLVRGQVLSLKEREFIDAARIAGASKWHIIFRQILPNLSGPLLVTASLALPGYVTAEAALSYLNVGVLPPTADWGATVLRSASYYQVLPTYMLIPGLALLLLVLSFNLLGDGVRDAFDPKSNRN